MNFREVLQRRKNHLVVKKLSKEMKIDTGAGRKPEAPDGLLKKCNYCKAAVLAEDVKQNDYICPKCQGYFRVHALRRIEMTTDPGSFEAWDEELEEKNPLAYKGYEEKLCSLREKTGLQEAIVIGKAKIDGKDIVIGVCDGRFLMASMGYAVGEKITRAVERATREKLPVILFACSGGARMQEGIISLMQMAKTSAALRRHSDAGNLYISVLTDPTTGGVTASFAMLGDLILAEPNALIGFAGPRVIEQTIGQKLPKGFQRAEFLLEHGFIDRIVERKSMKQELSNILKMHENNCRKICDSASCGGEDDPALPGVAKKTPWEKVLASRRRERPSGSFYIKALFDEFIELHGDRYFRDDPAIVAGLAVFEGMPVTVIAQEKGSSTAENIRHNFGMPSPDGYRKTLRLMKQAEKFQRPVICFVDTPGAFCGIEAEERGQGEAIARNLFEMAGLKVPVLTIVTGEGGSGGALALAAGDEVWMLENSVYSILSPEGFASILWKDSKRAQEAAKVMKLTAKDLKELGIIEQIFEEPEDLREENAGTVIRKLRTEMKKFLQKYCAYDEQELLEHRYGRFRKF